jgi:hypothetical protein
MGAVGSSLASGSVPCPNQHVPNAGVNTTPPPLRTGGGRPLHDWPGPPWPGLWPSPYQSSTAAYQENPRLARHVFGPDSWPLICLCSHARCVESAALAAHLSELDPKVGYREPGCIRQLSTSFHLGDSEIKSTKIRPGLPGGPGRRDIGRSGGERLCSKRLAVILFIFVGKMQRAVFKTSLAGMSVKLDSSA